MFYITNIKEQCNNNGKYETLECGNEFYLKLAPPDLKNVNAHFAVNYEGDKMIERIFQS
jgi:hypothetical protein